MARLNLKLDKDAEPLPKDSIFRVRYRSSFGLKYLEIIRGEGDPAPEGFAFNGLDDQTDRATACYLPGDPRFAEHRERSERLLRAADRVRRHHQHLRRADADERAHQPLRLRRRVRRPRDLAQRRDQQPASRCSRGLRPVTKVLLRAGDTQLRRFFPELGDAARIVAPVAEQQADVFTKGAITFAAISSDPNALQETISEGAADARDRDPTAAARAPVPRRLRDPQRGAAPRRQRPARDAAGAQRRDRRRHPGAAPLDRHQPQARGRAAPARPRSSTQPTTGLTLAAPRRRRSTRPSRWPSGSPRRRPSATTSTTGSPTCRTRSPTATRSATRSARCWRNIPGSTMQPASSAGYSGLQSNGLGDPAGRLQALRAPDPRRPRLPADRPAQRRLPGRPVRVRARPGPAARPVAAATRPTRVAGPARLARPDDALHQRRRPARAPRHADRLAPARDLGERRMRRRARLPPPAELG